MPTECPLNIPGTCIGCSDLWEDSCCWFFPKMPLKDLLTNSERIEMLEAKKPISTPWDKRQQYQIQQLKGEMIYLEKRINVMQKGRKRASIY